jgi:hypothetical protein
MERSLEDVENEYEKIAKKFDLPKFEKLVEDFDADKILEKEGGILIRDVRRTINDKLSAYLHLFETLMNPSSPPLFVLTFLKNISDENRKLIKETYKELSKMQLANMKLDTVFEEKKEAEFIQNSFNSWQNMKKKTYVLFGDFEKEFERNSEAKEKSYFG